VRPVSALLLLAACVPHAEVAGAPCPCPAGYRCCPTLSVCLSSADTDACPPAQPESSGNACTRDADCDATEVCQAWQGSSGALMGPQKCRKPCSADAPCAESERCQLLPHDGAPLAEADLVRACVPAEALGACDCSACDDTQVGRTFCEGTKLMGCFFSFDEACGVACQLTVAEDCHGEPCESMPGGGACRASSQDGDICTELSCDKCPAEPGATTCEADAIVSCGRVSYPGVVCEALCKPQTRPCPEGTSCSDDSTCAP
jgi:hypothetical protein